jgi:hypothetical protein
MLQVLTNKRSIVVRFYNIQDIKKHKTLDKEQETVKFEPQLYNSCMHQDISKNKNRADGSVESK